MKRKPESWSNARVERLVGYFLRVGVILASVIVFAGGIPYLLSYGATLPDYKIFTGEPADLRTVHGIVTDVFSLSSRGIIQFGLLILMFTPVAWVAFLLFAFAKQRDFMYVMVTAVVLCVLLFSLVGRHLFN